MCKTQFLSSFKCFIDPVTFVDPNKSELLSLKNLCLILVSWVTPDSNSNLAESNQDVNNSRLE